MTSKIIAEIIIEAARPSEGPTKNSSRSGTPSYVITANNCKTLIVEIEVPQYLMVTTKK